MSTGTKLPPNVLLGRYTRWEVYPNPEMFGVCIRIGVCDQDGRVRGVVKPLAMETENYEYNRPIFPALQLGHDTAKQLMNGLWRAGIRPDMELTVSELLVLQAEANHDARIANEELKRNNREPDEARAARKEAARLLQEVQKPETPAEGEAMQGDTQGITVLRTAGGTQLSVQHNPETNKYEIHRDGKRLATEAGKPVDGGGHDVMDTATRQAGYIIAGIEKKEKEKEKREAEEAAKAAK